MKKSLNESRKKPRTFGLFLGLLHVDIFSVL